MTNTQVTIEVFNEGYEVTGSGEPLYGNSRDAAHNNLRDVC